MTTSCLRCIAFVFAIVLLAHPVHAQDHGHDAPTMDDPIAYAESAGIPEIASGATILDAEGNVLREGTNGWTCMAVPDAPMCLDQQWMALIGALMSGNEDFKPTGVGLSYMLRGDAGASNTDPTATGPTEDNHWVQTGPHLMIIAPGPDALAGYPTDPSGGGAYVMWGGTPFAHLMVPVVPEAVHLPGSGH